ncbi:hypothetical protein L3Q82_001026 [Scortum barcoo]|uniref:Uncharacterized protein n=1 Tax=Scortum barcoo TaxID=214431 RepID=A0ACB8WAR7_9TELE|nr:hypothetical protein L3Q82_001026 [Scortum barcoo]
MKKLGPAAYDKVRSACQGEARQAHPVWDNAENAEYRNVLNNLMTALKEAFQTKIDMTKITECRQQPDETVTNYYTRLHLLLFNEHSGMTELIERGDTPKLWESHMMIKWFLDGLLPHISAAIKKGCVAYEDARLTELIRHAKHAERQITAEKTKKSDREKQAHSAHLTMVKTVTNLAENEQQRQSRNRRGAGFNRRGRGHHGKGGRGRQGEEGRSWVGKDECYIYHKKGHWAADCPQRDDDSEPRDASTHQTV